MKFEVVSYSLDGCLRLIRRSSIGDIQLRSPFYPGSWSRGPFRRSPSFERALECFDSQTRYHLDIGEVKQPGV